MITTPIRHFAITVLFTLLVASNCWGAKAPNSETELEKESTHVLTGQIVSVNSNIEKGIGNKDEIFTIKVKVASITKGEGIKIGEEIQVVAWKPHTRIGIAGYGLQGQDEIPKKGQTATFYLKLNGKIYEPLIPNGIDIQPHAQKKSDE